MTTTSMTTQEMNTFLEYQKSNLRVQRDELKAIKDQEEAKLKQIEIGESIVSMLEGLIANGSGSVECGEEEKMDEGVIEPDTSHGISALEQIADYSSDEDVIQQVRQKSAEPLPIKNDQGEVLWQNYTGEDLMVVRKGIKHNLEETDDVERISLDGDEAIQDIINMCEKDEDISFTLSFGKHMAGCAGWLHPLTVENNKDCKKGLLTTPMLKWLKKSQYHESTVRDFMEQLELERFGKGTVNYRYQYDTKGRTVREVKDFICKINNFYNSL